MSNLEAYVSFVAIPDTFYAHWQIQVWAANLKDSCILAFNFGD